MGTRMEAECSTCNFVASEGCFRDSARNPIQASDESRGLSARIQSAKAASKCASNRAHLRWNDVSEKTIWSRLLLSHFPPSLSLPSFLPSFFFSFFLSPPLLSSSPCFRINNPEQGLALSLIVGIQRPPFCLHSMLQQRIVCTVFPSSSVL